MAKALSDKHWSDLVSRIKDIAAAVMGKQDKLVSGTSIKTVNSNSLLGSGNVSVQSTLTSGTNIKTINGSSILGSGNLSVTATVGDKSVTAAKLADSAVTSDKIDWTTLSVPYTVIKGKTVSLTAWSRVAVNTWSLSGVQKNSVYAILFFMGLMYGTNYPSTDTTQNATVTTPGATAIHSSSGYVMTSSGGSRDFVLVLNTGNNTTIGGNIEANAGVTGNFAMDDGFAIALRLSS